MHHVAFLLRERTGQLDLAPDYARRAARALSKTPEGAGTVSHPARWGGCVEAGP
jgi:hypothetical protein